MNNGLVSIIIPTYNCKQWISDAIESSLRQSYSNCEIIVIDDGSTDNTHALVSKKYGSRIKYIRQDNLGLAAARNRGLQEASGDYIQFLDSDDIMAPNKLEQQVTVMRSTADSAVSYCDYLSIDINTNSIISKRYLTPVASSSSMLHSIISDWETRLSIPVHCFLFESQIFKKNNIFFDPLLPNHEDFDCWVRVFSHVSKAAYIDAKLAFYRIKPASMCSDRALMRYGFLKSLDNHITTCQDRQLCELLRIKWIEVERCYADVAQDAILAAEKKITLTNKRRFSHQESTLTANAPRIIAFHLPQYHAIPENDEWWGKGFTEWTNVTKASALFDGHYQPHVPSDLGYYDLSNPSAMKEQAAIAQEYGIHGFCFYHYWFNGKLLLETPLHQMLKSGEPDFPFCLCWANEDWTRAWDGRSGETLIAQNYTDSDDIRHFHYLLNFFEDKRYIKINGKPLFLVYRANRLPNPLKTTTVWRDLARKAGLGEIYLCRVESFSDEHTDPVALGFDAAVEFQPDWRELGEKLENPVYGTHRVYDYSTVVEKMCKKPDVSYTRYPCVTPSWDNSPRRKSDAVIFINSSPAAYQRWLHHAVNTVQHLPPEERLVFVNAWNEWGEGNHLEPDQKFDRSYLESTRAALSDAIVHIDDQILDNECQDALVHTAFIASIIIPVFNKLHYTKSCIRALISSTSDIAYEVIIIDNGSTDGTKEYLKNLSGDVTIITNHENVGYTIACNQGAAVARGNYLVFLNNDTLPQPQWLHLLIATVENDQMVGAVGAKLIYPDGALQEAGAIVFQDGSAQNFGRGDDPDRSFYNVACEVDYCSGACLLIPRNVFQELGGFDEIYAPAYYEETDFCFRLRERGYKVMYQPLARIIHYGSVTAGQDPAGPLRKYLLINKEKFLNRWKQQLLMHAPPPVTGGAKPLKSARQLVHARDNSYLFPLYSQLFESIEGWFMWEAVEVLSYFNNIQKFESVQGDLFEIGAYKGKLTLMLMTFAREGELLYVNDIFDMQHLNHSKSGCGANLADFTNNIAKLTRNYGFVKLLMKKSSSLGLGDVRGVMRIVSIDGGHSAEETYSDLVFASSVLSEHGIIIVDDIFHKDWPGVKSGVESFLDAYVNMRPLAAFYNKLLLVRKESLGMYDQYFASGSFGRCLTKYCFKTAVGLIGNYKCYAVSKVN